MPNILTVSTPGRICLFGEHQDYLGLPVIPAAISLRVTIDACRRKDRQVRIDLPDIHTSESFQIQGRISYTKTNDYLRSAVNVLLGHGFTFTHGFDATVRGRIPIQSGTSSSSALAVCWVNVLARMSDQNTVLPPALIARYAYEAEVVEFNEAGGMMDQYSTAYGGVLALDFFPDLRIQPIDVQLGQFVLGDSGEPKDTQTILSRVKGGVLDILKKLGSEEFVLQDALSESIRGFKRGLTTDQFELFLGTVRNHEITEEARRLLQTTPLDHRRLGELLTQHQTILRDVQRISTPKIDLMLDAVMKAGAYGGKINGSGGGGCMFAYAPENAERVAEAIERVGGKAYVVSVDGGTRSE